MIITSKSSQHSSENFFQFFTKKKKKDKLLEKIARPVQPKRQKSHKSSQQGSRFPAACGFLGGSIMSESKSTFHKAITDNNLEAAKAVAGQINVNVKDKDGRTALYKAADKGYSTIVEWLITLGADTNISSGNNNFPHDHDVSTIKELPHVICTFFVMMQPLRRFLNTTAITDITMSLSLSLHLYLHFFTFTLNLMPSLF